MKPGPKPVSAYERMMRKVEVQPDGCWLFKGSLNLSGHGNVNVWNEEQKKWVNKNAHAVSAEHHRGKLAKGLVWRHVCDINNCVNPDHLIEGTQLENMHDKIKRGRHAGCVKVDPAKFKETEDECPF